MSELRLPSQRVCVVLLMRIGDVVWRLQPRGPDDPADAGVSIARAERMKLISVRDVLDKVEIAKERYLLRKEAV
ncbi:MAG: hypothetical protein Q8W48_05015 [Candidatus Palauibacterales bacterium]|nr:hypothetical protein [Candidatus Palauibacterales bacterium]